MEGRRGESEGKLENCSRNEIEYLQHVSVPKLSSSIVHPWNDVLALDIPVPQHGCCLLLLTPAAEGDAG